MRLRNLEYDLTRAVKKTVFGFQSVDTLLASIEEPNPVLFFEHKALYRRQRETVPSGYYTHNLGEARLLSQGEALTIITYGLGVHWALEVLERHPEIEATLIDLRCLSPWDRQCVFENVKRTSKALVLHEDTLSGGFGAEIAAAIGEHCFEYLDAPVVRCASEDTPVPFARELEAEFLPVQRFEKALLELVYY